jgi:hypothetical protein
MSKLVAHHTKQHPSSDDQTSSTKETLEQHHPSLVLNRLSFQCRFCQSTTLSLMDFYSDQVVLATNDVDLYSAKIIWLQQFVIPEYTEQRELEPSNTGTDASIVQYQITTILTIMHSALPQLITRDLLADALKDNTSPFFKSLKLTLPIFNRSTN